MGDEEKLGDVKPEERFRTSHGTEVSNLRQLLKVLNDIGDDSYRHHVNDEKNDFANWIRHSVKDTELADMLDKTKDIEETKNIIAERIETLEKNAEMSKIRESIDSLKGEQSSIEKAPDDMTELVIEEPKPAVSPVPRTATTAPGLTMTEPIFSHPIDHIKKNIAVFIQGALIGFLVGLIIGYIVGVMG